MKFSIIVPAHNVENYISKCLNSIQSQVFTDYECIVICDSCVDNTEKIARTYPFIVESVNFTSAGLTRNVGLDIATGEYILFLDADDWFLHEYVLTELSKKISDEDILCYAFIWKSIGYSGAMSPKDILYPHVWNKCWKKSIIGDTRFIDNDVEDAIFHDEIMKKDPLISIWDMPFVYYNFLRTGSTSERLNRTITEAKEGWNIE